MPKLNLWPAVGEQLTESEVVFRIEAMEINWKTEVPFEYFFLFDWRSGLRSIISIFQYSENKQNLSKFEYTENRPKFCLKKGSTVHNLWFGNNLKKKKVCD